MILAAAPDQPRRNVTETVCKRCGRWLLVASPPVPLPEQLCEPCRTSLQADQENP